MFHYVYKTIDEDGFYYIGRHSTENLNDNYFGSGKWLKSKQKSKLKTVILQFCNSIDDLVKTEEMCIKEVFDDKYCMNLTTICKGHYKGIRQKPLTSEQRKDRSEQIRQRWKDGIYSDRTNQVQSRRNGAGYSQRLGHKLTETTKEKLSQKAKNRSTVKCSKCEKTGPIPQMKRWHFDNCKEKSTCV
jgi:hypothetical protein